MVLSESRMGENLKYYVTVLRGVGNNLFIYNICLLNNTLGLQAVTGGRTH